jgi:hypothetical protein
LARRKRECGILATTRTCDREMTQFAAPQFGMRLRRPTGELKRKFQGRPDAFNVLLQAHIPIRLADDGVVAVLRADALIAPDVAAAYMIGEIKSFAALHHNTDTNDVQPAAAQAGVYSVGLEERIAAPRPACRRTENGRPDP